MKKSILQRLADTMAERMTWERDKEDWSQFIKDVFDCILTPSGIHFYKWNRKGDRINIRLEDLVTGKGAWSENESKEEK